MYFFEDVFKVLNKAKVKYMIFGGVAAIMYGVHRTTGDFDRLDKMS